uniref:GDSL esterase/lipase At1g71691 n=1 Tax=Anthurium amnicola TaxID=1678845 RepID=A0A1D1YZW2_9ARAE
MAPMCFSLASLLLLIIITEPSTAAPEAQVVVPAMFVFGDSLIDPGNNNRLVSLARADYAPNGIDFPAGVTGRFCNGGTVADHLGELLDLPLIPPFNSPTTKGSQILYGVNYASAAAGILNDTGKLYGDLFSMDKQIQNFEKTLQDLNLQMGGREAGEFLRRSLFFVAMGSNDYLNNYLHSASGRSREYTPRAYTQLLIQRYSRQLKTLYKLGGRKFLIGGLGPLGCMPRQIRKYSHKKLNSCIHGSNQLALLFNRNLKMMLQDLNVNLSASHFLLWDTYSTSMEVINNFSQYGFRNPLTPCCGGGWSKGRLLCLPLLPLECRNRSEFVFWDPYHPTDAFNAIAAKRAFEGSLQTANPTNVQELIRL